MIQMVLINYIKKKKIENIHINLPNERTNVLEYMIQRDASSEESGLISVTLDLIPEGSIHKYNKIAYKLNIRKTASSDNYQAKIGFNLSQIQNGFYTIFFEFIFPENNNIDVTVTSSETLN